MLTCRDVSELATDYLEGRLSFLTRLRYKRHLRCCPPCACLVDQFQITIELLGCLPRDSLRPETRDEILHCFREWKNTRS